MQGSKKIPIIELNRHITCNICNGYFVDATTIIECLHTFCRSCIVKYLESNKYCPVCDVQVHKTKPLLNIRPDKTVQDIVYKLVPRLFQNEMQRRREFYEKHPEAKPSSLEQCGEASYRHLLTPEETICLTLSYHGSNNTPRYLRCPAAVSLGHLQKLIRAKYDLTERHRIEILYNQDCLNSSLTLMDVAYIYLWKRKGPIELTYRIYECTVLKPKLETEPSDSTHANHNNNNWKEVQLRISENGEMSITGIQDSALSPSLLEIVNSEQKYKNEVVTVMESKSGVKPATKKDLPGLKYIGKCTNNAATTSAASISLPPSTATTEEAPVSAANMTEAEAKVLEVSAPSFVTSCATLSSGTTTTVFSTINSSKCSTKSEELAPVKREEVKNTMETEAGKPTPSKIATVANEVAEKNLKRKMDAVAVSEAEPPVKLPKPTILNHSIGLLNLSTNHPLRKHSKLNRNGDNHVKNSISDAAAFSATTIIATAATKTSTATTTTDVTFSKPSILNKNFANVQLNRPGTPIMTSKPSIMSTKPCTTPPKLPTTSYGMKSPCYMPKTTYNPVINVPKPTIVSGAPQNTVKNEVKPTVTSISMPKTAPNQIATSPNVETRPSAAASQAPQQPVGSLNNKMAIKAKPSTPVGYKTLRDPPKSWNSQISKANLTKPAADPKYSELKNVRPAKFFKMRNNMPRYLGNPASGVKPMYQVHVSPDKDKPHDSPKTEKSEIRKHSIVKIDPKTLKPISEKAPETTSLSNHSSSQIPANHTNQNTLHPGQGDLKINTSSVSIFNPLKLQSSPKNERKSPKSSHSPKLKAQSSNSPTGSKREKVNLNFTPPNPFIPNLTSPTLSPNQFLYPTGPPGFPSYDPRMMAAYHSLWYGQRMAFPASPIPGLNLDLNQRKNFDMLPSPTSPKMGGSLLQGHSPQISTKMASTTSSNSASVSRNRSLLPAAPWPSAPGKKGPKEPKSEKSLETTVEKLRNKEISSKSEPVSAVKNAGQPESDKGKRLEAPNEKEQASDRLSATRQEAAKKSGEGKIEVKSKEQGASENRKSVNTDCGDNGKKPPCIDRGKETAKGEISNSSNTSGNGKEVVAGGK